MLHAASVPLTPTPAHSNAQLVPCNHCAELQGSIAVQLPHEEGKNLITDASASAHLVPVLLVASPCSSPG
jgi:hypothetical protein